MSIVDWNQEASASARLPAPVAMPRLHRIATVRQQQGISLRSAGRRMRMDVSQVRLQEDETCDLPLSALYRWKEALGVPLVDLIDDESDELSTPVRDRARLVKLMKTAAAIREQAECDATRRLAEMLANQLVELMPELADVSPWHAVGQRRSLEEMGRIVEHSVSDDWLFPTT